MKFGNPLMSLVSRSRWSNNPSDVDLGLIRRWRKHIAWTALLGILVCSLAAIAASDPDEQQSLKPKLIKELEQVIRYEMADKQLPGFAIVLVDKQKVVWRQTFQLDDNGSLTITSNFRVASLSKLFTDVAIMQLVEHGQLDLDTPIFDYLPDFHPTSPFDKPITIRQLMSHRSGLVREPPVGNYFDASEPDLATTVHSLNDTRIVYEPESRSKYSNAALAVMGYLLQQQSNERYEDYMQRHVLEPLGMTHSSFRLTPAIKANMAPALRWSYDGQEFEAPVFQFGMSPAINLNTTLSDLAQFLKMTCSNGVADGRRILESKTLQQMMTPQFVEANTNSGFGLGFYVGELDGQRSLSHSGVVYGFATEIKALPDAGLGAVAIATRDAVNIVVERIVSHALRLMLAYKSNQQAPAYRYSQPVDGQRAKALAGNYVSEQRKLELIERNGELYTWSGATLAKLKQHGDTLLVDGRLDYGMTLLPIADGELLVNGNHTFRREPEKTPPPAPERWRGVIGEYGWDHIPLVILEQDQRLYALIEWLFLYPLQELDLNTFAFPVYGMYHGEQIVFTRDARGVATEVLAGTMQLPRRNLGVGDGQTYKIAPIRAIEELRVIAQTCEAPAESGDFLPSDLVEIVKLDSTIKLDIRYATDNNFMGAVFYRQGRAFMQKPAAEALVRAHRKLMTAGYGLLIHDAYRPWYVTKMFWDATPEQQKIFVANPSRGSRHNRGAAVDLTLYDRRTGMPVEMVSGYDEFSARAYAHYTGGTSLQRWHRELLRHALEAEGFQVYEWEWWHFDYKDWKRFRIHNLSFEEVDRLPRREPSRP